MGGGRAAPRLVWQWAQKDGKTNRVKYKDKYGSREADMKNVCLDGLALRHGKKMGKLTELSITTNMSQGRQIWRMRAWMVWPGVIVPRKGEVWASVTSPYFSSLGPLSFSGFLL